ncbi:2-hydroxyacid dehydrogenase [Geminicoccaceae bacterium 1502E]|nr:2-hydroxyacid dehydrogenase [Geminicoccaceae bacterium 1502E]
MDSASSNEPLAVGIIGDGFMQPSYFVEALQERFADRPLAIETMTLGWPIERNITKVDPELSVQEFVGRPEQFFEFISRTEILVNHLAPVTRETFERAPRLKLIAVSRGGPINIDMKAAADHGVQVVNTPGRNASAVAEFTIASMLAETRNLIRGHIALARGEYRGDLYHRDITGPELCELTVGVIGYGHVGTRVVRMLKPFGCRILVNDPYKQLSREDLDDGVVMADLDTVLREADIVTLHPRVTQETRGMIGAAQFAAMKKGAYFVNTARGPLVDYDALHEALVSGQLAGAALDTFAFEPPPPGWPLLELPNVTLSPHIAGASRYTIRKAAVMAAEEVARFVNRQAPLHPCT